MERPVYRETVAPVGMVLEVAEVKEHIRYDSDEENNLIANMIIAATAFAQEYQWSQLLTATRVIELSRFPTGSIALHPNPVQSITTVAYNDTSGDAQTLTANTHFVLDEYKRPALLMPAYNTTWPATRGYPGDVTITFVAGYGNPMQVPQQIKQGLLMLVAHWYANRCGGCDVNAIPIWIRAMFDLNTFKGPY